MSLREKITADLLNAMKAREETRVGALRMLKAAVMKFEVSGGEKVEANDEQVMQIIGKEAKQRKDSIDAFKKGGREDLAAGEEAELKILTAYLPAQMSEDEVRAIVKEVVAQTGASSKADIGKVMGGIMPKVKGKADGQMVNRIVGEFLK